ncbi:MAG: hypothetical protein U5K00_05735 [Melioribacteraceae bacterium]|nr:hypothetical protein [Melioribacteraceae bacterium]
MSSIIKFVLTAILIYIIFKFARILFRIFTSTRQPYNKKSNVSDRDKRKSKIDKDDIIEAEFEEIKDNEKEKSQD